MNAVTITLTDPEIMAIVDKVVASGSYETAGDYVATLIREDQGRRKARLEALLLEGMEGEATPLTDADWDGMRRRYDERHPEVSGA